MANVPVFSQLQQTAVNGLPDVNRNKVEALLPESGRGDREDERNRVIRKESRERFFSHTCGH